VAKKDKKKKAKRVEEVALAEVVAVPETEDGARLGYGEPVREGGRTVIPVARGGEPVGYIEIDAAGTRYTPIGDRTVDRLHVGVVAAVAGLLGALLGVALGRRAR
jgi:hypothetical protein